MSSTRDRLFHKEVGRQCEFGLWALSQLRAADGEPTQTWASIQLVLVSAANLSKLMERSSKRFRRAYSVTNEDAFMDRDLRNYFEHFDRHLTEACRRGVVVDENIAPKGSIVVRIKGFEEGARLREYDPVTGAVTCLGIGVATTQLGTEMRRLLSVATEFGVTDSK